MQEPEQAMHLLSSARTSKGRVRGNNEDRIHLSAAGDALLAVIADGMGGAAAGEEASRIAIEAIEHGLNAELEVKRSGGMIDTEQFISTLTQTIRSANAQILQTANSQPQLKGMGTTLTLALVDKTEVTLAHIGDSRAYLISGYDGQIRQITVDHSFVQALLDAGHITSDEAEDHPMRNVLYRALGQAAEVEIDVIQGLRLHSQDRLILCSDGLTLHVSPQEIARSALSHHDPDLISKELVDLANARGGKDNISIITVIVDAPAEEAALAYLQFENDDEDVTLPMSETFPIIINPEEEPPVSISDSGRFSISGGDPAEDDDTFKPQP